MRLHLETPVEQSVAEVGAGFTEKLFLKLAPPFPPVRLLQFDGSRRGDVVSLELNFIFFKQVWSSDITEAEAGPGLFRFVDEGRELPFFLGSWRHHHLVEDRQGTTVIVDDITFRGRYSWMTPLLYPVLFLQFWYRKPIYRKFFRA